MKAFFSDAGAIPDSALGWQRPEAVPMTMRPGALWSWLIEPGSLTARLRRHCGDGFGVQVLASGPGALEAGEVAWIGRENGYVREVYLCCGETPWIHARTIAPNGGAPEERLRNLGRQPLGDWAFEQPSARRGGLEVAGQGADWARRSTLSVDGRPLYIIERFLTGVTPWA